jgi:hypothetical protein
MFRGGIADSEGVGITSGLDTPKRGLVDEPGGYAGELSFGERFRMAMEQDNANKKARYDALKSDKSYNLNLSSDDIYNSSGSPSSFLQSIYDTINPSTETIVKRLQENQLAQREPLIKTQSYREEQKRIAKIMEDKERVEKLKLEENEKLKTAVKGTGTETGVRAGGTEQPAKSDLRTVYEDLLPLFSKELGASEDEFSRQKYLELAKFGLNLLRQPGGLPGGKSDLLGAIAASAEKPLEGYQAIISKEQQAKRLPKALALEAAMKISDPSDISKKIKSLAQISGLSEQQVAKSFITTGESSLKSITSTAESLAEDVGKLPALKIATTMQEAGISISQVKKLPKDTKGNIVGDKVHEGFYYDNDGTLYKFGKDKKLQPVITK